MEWSMRVIFCALGMSIAHEEKHFGDCDLWFIICCRLAVILPLIRCKFAASLPLIRCFFASSSLILRFGVVCSPLFFRYFPLFSVVERRNNGEQTNVERISNESRTEIERRMNGEWTEKLCLGPWRTACTFCLSVSVPARFRVQRYCFLCNWYSKKRTIVIKRYTS